MTDIIYPFFFMIKLCETYIYYILNVVCSIFPIPFFMCYVLFNVLQFSVKHIFFTFYTFAVNCNPSPQSHSNADDNV